MIKPFAGLRMLMVWGASIAVCAAIGGSTFGFIAGIGTLVIAGSVME